MPVRTVKINDDLDSRVKAYCERYHMTYTSFVTIALVRQFDQFDMSEKMKALMLEALQIEKNTAR